MTRPILALIERNQRTDSLVASGCWGSCPKCRVASRKGVVWAATVPGAPATLASFLVRELAMLAWLGATRADTTSACIGAGGGELRRVRPAGCSLSSTTWSVTHPEQVNVSGVPADRPTTVVRRCRGPSRERLIVAGSLLNFSALCPHVAYGGPLLQAEYNTKFIHLSSRRPSSG